MNTSSRKLSLDTALRSIPQKFRSRIVETYLEQKRRLSQASYDASFDSAGLSAGKFCESVLRFLQQQLSSTYIPFGKRIPNFVAECEKLAQVPVAQGSESLRVILPRSLVFIYTLRSKRGIGHIGGDVDANEIDCKTVLRVCDWVMCELIRIYHGVSLEQAQALVDAISTRSLPEVWQVGGKKRVLRKGLSYRYQVLVLLYSEVEAGVSSVQLFEWTEHSNMSVFRRDVLRPLHRDRMIEYDEEMEVVMMSPLGIQEVEDKILSPRVGSQ